MSRMSESSEKFSPRLQKRLIEFIKDEDYTENGKPCNNEEFAKRAGVSRDVISKIVNYSIIPSVKSLVTIADYLNTSLEYLLGRTADETYEPSENPSTFHKRLIELKEESKLKFADIAKKCSFSGNSPQVWLKRENLPSLDYLIELANVFNVTLDYLLGRTDYRN